MPAVVVRLRTRPDRLRADQAEQLRQMVLAFPDLPERAAGDLLAYIDGQTAAENGWTFVMMSPQDNNRVVRWLLENSKLPMLAVNLWSELFLHLRRDNGDIMKTRDELADAVGMGAQDVSRVMSELEDFGAITRQRIKMPGMKGPGMVRYRMNPVIATHLKGAARDKAQAKAPRLVPDPPAGA
jgi:hypothetical protein